MIKAMSVRIKNFSPKKYKDPKAAVSALQEIYHENVRYLRECFEEFIKSPLSNKKYRACYPYIKVETTKAQRSDTRLSYGFVSKPGVYTTTVTKPDDIFDNYLIEQIRLLMLNHDCRVEIGVSETPMPLHFALGADYHLESQLDDIKLAAVSLAFDTPDLEHITDEIANATFIPEKNDPMPLALFDAPRVDLSLLRLQHYTATKAKYFQNYVIFTNYQFYIDEFIRIGHELMQPTDDSALKKDRTEYCAFVEPGNKIATNRNLKDHGGLKEDDGVALARLPQMPAYHLMRPDGSGITMVNIGVGPSNAKTITDHIAVLRPHAWLMLGHCAGLRNSQQIGDYVLAHGYLREDNVLFKDLHPSIPIPPLAEIQQALETSVAEVTGLKGYDLKKIMRTGTVATVDDRNWELRSAIRNNRRLSQSRAIALDMESGTIAANGFRFRVPYGTLLCVSDKPLHGQLKLPGMAKSFYRERVDQHLQIGLQTMALLRDIGPAKLHSRKLRSFNEVAFQ